MEEHGLELARDFGPVAMGFTVHAQRDPGDDHEEGNR
jgi:hypothetical protein